MVLRTTRTDCLQCVIALGLAGVGVVAHAGEDSPSGTSPPVFASELVAESAIPGSEAPVTTADATLASAPPSRWSATSESLPGGYRWSLSRGTFDLGLRFESSSPWLRPHDARADAVGPLVPALPALSLGLRHAGPGLSAGSLLSRSYGTSENYVSKVGIEWKPAESRVNFLREGLGIRLEGNDRMTVRLRKGVIGVYMHRKF